MKMTHRSIAIGALLLLLSSACSMFDRQATTTPGETQAPSANSSSVSIANETTVAWKNVLGTTPLPQEWRISPCDAAVYLCVQLQNKPVGSIELNSFPVEKTELNALLAEGSDRSGSLNASSPETRLKALQIWVENHYNTIKRDRQTGLGKQAVFSSQKPEVVSVGELQGLRYGFTTSLKANQLFERSVGYVATDGKVLYVITTSVPDSDAGGTFTNDATLQKFEPHLQQIVAGLKL
jgi:hypothetical protein